MLHVTAIYNGHPIHMIGIPAGPDINVTLYGGTHPHIGGLAMSVMSPALHEQNKQTCTSSMLSVQGHKEAELAKTVASTLARHFGCTVSVACGIHYPQATPEQIGGIVQTTEDLTRSFITTWEEKLKGEDF